MSKKSYKIVIKKILWILLLSLFFGFNFTTVRAAEISRDARNHMLRGEAAMEVAKDATDYKDAVNEFMKAIKYAPDWYDAWYNLGVAQEAAGDYTGAIKSFNKYLNLNPQASDRPAIEDRIIKLEYKKEKAEREQAEREEKESFNSLSGTWSAKHWEGDFHATPNVYGRWSSDNWPANVTVTGNNFNAIVKWGVFTVEFNGNIYDNRIQGEVKVDKQSSRECPQFPYFYVYPLKGKILSDQGKIILISNGWLQNIPSCRIRSDGYQWCYLLIR